VGYAGPILLECIRHLRKNFADLKPEVVAELVAPASRSTPPSQRL
jgi:hypothetical protein